MYDIPEGKRATRGKSIMNFIALGSEEKITSILPVPKAEKGKEGGSLIMVTKQGVGKRVAAKSFADVRASGIIAIKLAPDDLLVSVSLVDSGDSVSVVTTEGQSIRFKESDAREMGRSAGGVRLIKLDKKDFVIGGQVARKGAEKPMLLVVYENGYGKKTDLEEYKVQNRGGSGIKTGNVTAKTGRVIASVVVTPEQEEIVAISKKGQVIRTSIEEIPELGRQTQGVRIMKLREGDMLASVICF